MPTVTRDLWFRPRKPLSRYAGAQGRAGLAVTPAEYTDIRSSCPEPVASHPERHRHRRAHQPDQSPSAPCQSVFRHADGVTRCAPAPTPRHGGTGPHRRPGQESGIRNSESGFISHNQHMVMSRCDAMLENGPPMRAHPLRGAGVRQSPWMQVPPPAAAQDLRIGHPGSAPGTPSLQSFDPTARPGGRSFTHQTTPPLS